MLQDDQTSHILVINSSTDLLDLKREIFEDEGFRVTTRVSLREVIYELTEIDPDLLILDYSADSESALLNHFLEDRLTRRIPVILCTGAIRDVEAIRPQLEDIGVAIVYQPFDIDEIVGVVTEALGLTKDPKDSLRPQAD